MRGAGCCCGGAARGFTRAGAMSDNDDIEVESDVSWAPNPGTIPGITPCGSSPP